MKAEKRVRLFFLYLLAGSIVIIYFAAVLFNVSYASASIADKYIHKEANIPNTSVFNKYIYREAATGTTKTFLGKMEEFAKKGTCEILVQFENGIVLLFPCDGYMIIHVDGKENEVSFDDISSDYLWRSFMAGNL